MLSALSCALALSAPGPTRAAAEPYSAGAARVLAARQEAGVAPSRGLAALHYLRADALAQQRIDLRLAVDEAECRVLADIDTARALEVADAGIGTTSALPLSPVREPWLRLRVCRAGMRIDQGQPDAGWAELETLYKLTGLPADASIRALVQLERGAHLSRIGEWDRAQADLLAACETLQASGPQPDHELCQGHLAIHYQRVGDTDEALRLQQRLLAAARQRGATYDASIHSYGIAQCQAASRQWDAAIRSYEEALQASQQLEDSVGVAYAEGGLASARMRLGQPGEALAHVERALTLLEPTADPRRHEASVVTRAVILEALGRTAEADAELTRIEPTVRRRGEEATLGDWLRARWRTQRAQGHWRDAFQALHELRNLETRLHEQQASRQAAMLRMQFNRARDAEDLSALRQLNEQGQRLRETQAVALLLFLILLALVVGVAARKIRQTRRLQHLASTDELTGLANRRSLLASTQQAIAQAHRAPADLALLMIDIDHFKRINDAHGHGTGDDVLRHASAVLSSCLRDRDILGRVGGEEFVAVLPGASLDQALHVAERMRAAIAAARTPRAQGGIAITVSIGVAALRPDETASALLNRADAALYRAKNGGRNAVAADEGAAAPRPGEHGVDREDSAGRDASDAAAPAWRGAGPTGPALDTDAG